MHTHSHKEATVVCPDCSLPKCVGTIGDPVYVQTQVVTGINYAFTYVMLDLCYKNVFIIIVIIMDIFWIAFTLFLPQIQERHDGDGQ